MSSVFGPVSSRRFGSCLGIANVPAGTCTYACSACPPHPARADIERRPFVAPARIAEEVAARVAELGPAPALDALSFLPGGEPTLDERLAETIELLRPLGVPIALATNGSLLWRFDVREAVRPVDRIAVRIDTTSPFLWQRLNRPSPSLRLAEVLEGVRQLACEYRGKLITETTLVGGINDDPACVEETAEFLAGLRPSVAFLWAPPPAAPKAPAPEALARATAVFREHLARVACGTTSARKPPRGDGSRRGAPSDRSERHRRTPLARIAPGHE